MKIIPTEFRGIKFRSRLEARWAVFMDTLAIPYDYEPEGYDLDGLFYLPDFWLPAQKIFFEIKPEEPTNEEEEKAARLAAFTKRAVLIQFGQPRRPDFGIGNSMIFISGPGGWDCPYWWCECPTCGALDIQFQGRSGRIKCRCAGHEDRDSNFDSPRLLAAYERAQAFQFWTPQPAATPV